MSAQDHYSLRWNNHQNHILRAFDALLQTKTLVDVTLVCAETSIRAHKMVLSACSPFFQRVFAETPCKHPVIVLKDFRGWVVQAIVDFMYRGEISVPQERLQTLIQAGESLQVRGLVENSVPGNTPTPAASPDDFGGMMDTSSLLPSDLGRCSPNYDDESSPPTMVSSNSKLLLPSHIFSDNNNHIGSNCGPSNLSNPDLCTSPMPRRKQARPRRRSGECGPHDFCKSLSPHPEDREIKLENNQNEEKTSSTTKINEDIQRPLLNLDVDNNMQEQHGGATSNTTIATSSTTATTPSIPNASSTGAATTTTTATTTTSSNRDNSPEGPENLCTKKDNINDNPHNMIDESIISNNNNNNNNNNNPNNNNRSKNNRIVLSLKDIRHLNKPPLSINRSPNPFQPSHLNARGGDSQSSMKSESMEGQIDNDSLFPMEQVDLSMAAAAAAAAAAQHHHHQQQMVAASNLMNMTNSHQTHHGHHHDRLEEVASRMNKEFTPSSPMNLPSHFNPPDGPPHPPSPLPFPGMSSALTLTPPHMFGLDSPLGLFPPGMDPGKLYNPLMEMSDPRGLPNDHPPFLKKKMSRPKGQHSAPRGGPPRSWTNAELTEALQHVWNKKMTTSQASRIFGIPYNSLLMYVRGKYGKSLKLEQLRKDCISGPPIELLTMGMNNSNNNNNNNNNNKGINENRTKDLKDLEGPMQRSSSSEPDLLSSPNPLFNPFPPGFYPDFPGGFPGLPLGMLNLLPPERHQPSMHLSMDEDCKSDRSKQSLDEDFSAQPLALNRDDRRELLQQNGQD